MKRRISIDNGCYIPSIEQLSKDIDTVIIQAVRFIKYLRNWGTLSELILGLRRINYGNN